MDYLDTLTIELCGRAFEVQLLADDGMGAPWDEHDGHGIIRDGSRHTEGMSDKLPGERPMNDAGMREVQFFYDVAQTMRVARRDGWGLPDDARAALAQKLGRAPTAREVTAEAVLRDFEYCSGWARGAWQFVGVSVRIINADGEPEGDAQSVFGVESLGDYWREVARELAADIMGERREAWRAALREAREARYWAARDVATV